MDKLTLQIDPAQWGNLITKYKPYSPRLTETDFTQGTSNIDTDTNGSLSKRKGGPNYNPTLLSNPAKDQYEAIFADGTRHLLVVFNGTFNYSSGDSTFNSVVNGTGFNTGANFEFVTTQDRVYGDNKTDNAQVYDRNASYGGVSYSVPRLKEMGAQPPASAPSVAVVSGGAVPTGSHTYKITFLYYDSEESNGGPSSAVATVSGSNSQVNLSSIPIGGYGVTARNIYRDDNDGNWVLLDQISDNTTTTYSDVLAVGVTPTPIPTNNGAPPVFGLVSLWLDRLWLAQIPGAPNILFYSEVGQPDIYGAENQLLCNQEDPITAMIVYFDRLIIFNRRSMGQIIGSTPDTFRYAAIPSSIGCVDNRTLQIHVLRGVPVLLWLSERGFYTYDGNSINYISDWIEDLVNFNIRQALQQKGSNVQSTQAQFISGTPSNGINLTTLPGSITNKGYDDGSSTPGNNPRRTWNDQFDWEGGSVKSNVVTEDGTDQIKSPTKFEPDLASGTLAGSMQFGGGTLHLPQSTAFTGEANTRTTITTLASPYLNDVASAIIPARSGTLTTIKFAVEFSGNSNFTVTVQTDAGGQPSGTILGSGTLLCSTFGSSLFTSSSMSVPLTGGIKYWIVVTALSNQIRKVSNGNANLSGGATLTRASNGVSSPSGPWGNPFSITAAAGYNFSYTHNAISGSWTSTINDTHCVFFDPSTSYQIASLNLNLLNNACSMQMDVQGSNDPLFATFTVVSSDIIHIGDPLSYTHALQNFRFWRLKIILATTDDVFSPNTTGERLSYTTNPTSVPQIWVSEAIDTSSDSTVYNSLSMVSTTPAGTSVTMTIATSADNLSYSSFVAFGSHTVQRYAKIKLTLVMDSSQTVTPSVTSVNFTWTIVSNFVSVLIDTAVAPPAGWDIFLAQFNLHGGSIQFQFASGPAPSDPGTGGFPFVNVTPGLFPSNPVYQYVKWKVIITSADGLVPVIDSVVVQWFISIVSSIRPASIFVDGRYYVALAELSQTTNNLILELDLNGKWRRLGGITVSTFSYFFNRPYYSLATSGQVRKFLEGFVDGVTAIEFDARTKAFDFSTPYKDVSEKLKIVGELIVHIRNTGAALQFMYSVDNGATFYPFYTLDGSTTYQTTSDGSDIYIRVKPSWTNGNPIAGRHIMYRIYNNDVNEVQIHELKAQAMVRKQPPVVTG